MSHFTPSNVPLLAALLLPPSSSSLLPPAESHMSLSPSSTPSTETPTSAPFSHPSSLCTLRASSIFSGIESDVNQCLRGRSLDSTPELDFESSPGAPHATLSSAWPSEAPPCSVSCFSAGGEPPGLPCLHPRTSFSSGPISPSSESPHSSLSHSFILAGGTQWRLSPCPCQAAASPLGRGLLLVAVLAVAAVTAVAACLSAGCPSRCGSWGRCGVGLSSSSSSSSPPMTLMLPRWLGLP